MKTIKLKVNGMHCGSCAILIGDILEEISGVSDSEVSYPEGITTIHYDETKTDENTLKSVIRKEGYEV